MFPSQSTELKKKDKDHQNTVFVCMSVSILRSVGSLPLVVAIGYEEAKSKAGREKNHEWLLSGSCSCLPVIRNEK